MWRPPGGEDHGAESHDGTVHLEVASAGRVTLHSLHCVAQTQELELHDAMPTDSHRPSKLGNPNSPACDSALRVVDSVRAALLRVSLRLDWYFAATDGARSRKSEARERRERHERGDGPSGSPVEASWVPPTVQPTGAQDLASTTSAGDGGCWRWMPPLIRTDTYGLEPRVVSRCAAVEAANHCHMERCCRLDARPRRLARS